MGYVPRPTWAPSQRPYAVRPDTQTWDRARGWVTVQALWAGRKRGRITVTIGHLKLWSQFETFTTLEEALARADTRYGGDWLAAWDGSTLLAEPSHPLTPAEHAALAAVLADYLRGLPSVPDGWLGWFYRETSS